MQMMGRQHGLVAGDVSITSVTVTGFEGTVDIRLGRTFSEGDTAGRAPVVVVNETMARTYFPRRSPIGQMLRIGGAEGSPEVTIIGVVADMPFDSPRRRVPPGFFRSYLQEPELGGMTFEVRTATPPLDLVPAVREAIREIEPTLPIHGFMTEERQIAQSYREERLYATLATTIGVVGVLLAAIGLYGLLAYQVAQRTQELGVRMALGATRGALARLVLAQSFRLAAAGALLGLLASLAGTRVLAGVLFGLSATDPATLAGAILLLLVVAALAGYLPARHAARVDPLVALRAE
jgi:ABC-type antimicrobial peptide transport system permease subunit